MKLIFLLAGAAALAIGAPASARPAHGHHQDHGHGHANGHGQARARGHARAHGNARGHANAGRRAEHRAVARIDRRTYRDDRRYEHHANRHARRFARGQRYRPGYGVYYSYGRIPWRLRREYRLNDRYRYYYSDGYIYVVDPRTMLIEQVIAALLG